MSFSESQSGMLPADQLNPYEGDTGEPVKKSSFGCCLWSCLTITLFTILAFVAAGIGGYFWLTSTVEQYTSATPDTLPQVQLTEEQVVDLEARVESFQQSVKQGEEPQQLVLTADDLNALIQQDEQLKGRVHVVIQDGQIAGRISIPADMIPGGKGRYFNASATFDVSVENGVLIVTCSDAEVKGEKLPSAFIEGLKQENLAKDAYKNPEFADLLRRIERLEVQDDKVLIQSRPAPPSSTPPPSATPPTP
jgi:hypothetical protein